MEKEDFEELQEAIEQEVVDEEEESLEEEEVLEQEESSDGEEEESEDLEGAEEEQSEDDESVEEEDEDIISIGDDVINEPDEEDKKAPRWVKDVRKQNREQAKKIKELEAQLHQSAPPASPSERRAKPTLESHDYDSDAYETDYAAWVKEEAVHEKAEEQTRLAQQEEEKAWQEKLNSYNEAKKNLKVRDYEEAEATALESFSDTQKGIILQGADNPALLVYAIGKSKDKSEALAKTTDPVKFAFEVAKIESRLKVTKRSAPPAPEKKVSGKGAKVSNAAGTLDKLRDEAANTGDFTKVRAFRKKHNL